MVVKVQGWGVVQRYIIIPLDDFEERKLLTRCVRLLTYLRLPPLPFLPTMSCSKCLVTPFRETTSPPPPFLFARYNSGSPIRRNRLESQIPILGRAIGTVRNSNRLRFPNSLPQMLLIRRFIRTCWTTRPRYMMSVSVRRSYHHVMYFIRQ